MDVSGHGQGAITDFLQIVAVAGLLLNTGAIRPGVDRKSEGSELSPRRPGVLFRLMATHVTKVAEAAALDELFTWRGSARAVIGRLGHQPRDQLISKEICPSTMSRKGSGRVLKVK